MLVVWLTSVLALGALLLLLLRQRRQLTDRWTRFRHFQRTIDAIPGPRSYPLVGTTYRLLAVARTDIPRVLQAQFDEFPRLSRTWLGPLEAHVHITRAEHMEIVLGSSGQHADKSWSYRFLWPWLGGGLLTANGDRWRTHRKIITPAFHFGILETFGEIFAEKSRVLADKLAPWAESGEVVDVYPLITLAALDIVAEAAMGCEVHAQDGTNNEYVASISRMGELLLRRLIRPWVYWDRVYAWTSDGRMAARTLNTLHSFTNAVIKQRRATLETDSAAGKGDGRRLNFLDMLLLSDTTPPLSDTDIREEVDTFMFEGHDTTTSGMAWTMLLLGLHPEWQELVYSECADIFGGDSTPGWTTAAASQADVGRMTVLERVIKESMRLYPPVPNISRRLTADVTLDGYRVPGGTTAIIEIMHLHQDERFFPDHERFDPDRFLPQHTNGRHPFAFLPFSAGSRNCIGQKFAMFEEKSLISTLVRRFRWRAAVSSRHDLDFVYELIMRPVNGIPLVFEKR